MYLWVEKTYAFLRQQVVIAIILQISWFVVCVFTWQLNREARSIVIEEHTNENGSPQVLSVTHENGTYLIEREKEGNCQTGTDRVDDESGEVEVVTMSIC